MNEQAENVITTAPVRKAPANKGRPQLTEPERQERDRRICLMHMAGVSYREIAETVGCSAQTAFIAVKVSQTNVAYPPVEMLIDAGALTMTLRSSSIEQMRLVYTVVRRELQKARAIGGLLLPESYRGGASEQSGQSGQSASEEGGQS